ncbi:MAG: ribonuclease T [Succinivibrionaceae bacterium]|nr:ribonuclease T [Succinivibrionaceae bacterium]
MAEQKMMKDRFRTYLPVVVDVETAGFDPEASALLEISFMLVTMDERGMLHPGEQMSANILPFEGSTFDQSNLDFLGIKDPAAEDRHCIGEEEALRPMFKFVSKAVKAQDCTKAILVGHNGSFDLSFVKAAAARIGYKRFPFHMFSILDTASLSGLVTGQTVLSKACRALGLSFDDDCAHSAAYDTRMECELFCALVNRFTTFAGFPEALPDEVAKGK